MLRVTIGWEASGDDASCTRFVALIADGVERFGRNLVTVCCRVAQLQLEARQDPALAGRLEAYDGRLEPHNATPQA